MSWIALVALAVGTFALRAFGPVLFGERKLSPRTELALAITPIAVLAALAVIQTLWSPAGYVIDARFVGVAAAVIALSLRAPFIVAVAAAMLAGALYRLVGFS